MACTTAASAASISPPLTTTLFASSRSPAPLEPVTSAATAFASSRTSNSTSLDSSASFSPVSASTGPPVTLTVSTPALSNTLSVAEIRAAAVSVIS